MPTFHFLELTPLLTCCWSPVTSSTTRSCLALNSAGVAYLACTSAALVDTSDTCPTASLTCGYWPQQKSRLISAVKSQPATTTKQEHPRPHPQKDCRPGRKKQTEQELGVLTPPPAPALATRPPCVPSPSGASLAQGKRPSRRPAPSLPSRTLRTHASQQLGPAPKY